MRSSHRDVEEPVYFVTGGGTGSAPYLPPTTTERSDALVAIIRDAIWLAQDLSTARGSELGTAEIPDDLPPNSALLPTTRFVRGH